MQFDNYVTLCYNNYVSTNQYTQFAERMKDMSKNLWRKRRRGVTEMCAVLAGLVFAGCWQGFACLMVWLSDHEAMRAEYLVPNWGIMLVITPIVAWACFGLFKVSWLTQWTRITLRGMAFIVPSVIIAMVTLFAGQAALWSTPTFWLVNIAISAVIALTVFRPFIRYKA